MKYYRQIAFLFLLVFVSVSMATSKSSPSLRDFKGDSAKVWVFFTDKDTGGKSLSDAARRSLSERAIERRRKAGIPLEIADAPVNDSYIEQVEALGGRLLRKSRWLNGASFMLPSGLLEPVSALPSVKEIRPVGKYRRPIEPRGRHIPDAPPHDGDYGATLDQLELMGAIHLHDLGYTGEGVLVGFLDSGFRLTHRAFDSLDVVAKYDFIYNDTTVDYDSLAGDHDRTGYRHGTQTLGCVAGYSPGEYMGAAYRASVALAKTEDVDSEYVTEEDNWVAGIEWLDSVGADIISSSLGYADFEEDTPYTIDDLDGNTFIVTIAADIAARLGICVVNSAGNERGGSWGTLVAPSDGDSVLAVAAVGLDHIIAPFSSPGPSADGRIKPDCAALGYGAVLIDAEDTMGVVPYGCGTSFSCPLLAGLCAAVKSANPELYGYDLALAVRRSGDRYRAFDPAYPADSADNDYGWGIPKGPVAAGLYKGFYGRVIDAKNGEPLCGVMVNLDYGAGSRTVYSDTFGIFVDPLAEEGDPVVIAVPGFYIEDGLSVDGYGHAVFLERLGSAASIQVFPNPVSDSLTIVVYDSDRARFSVYSMDGNLVFDKTFAFVSSKRFRWDLCNQAGKPVANGVYLIRIAADDEEIIRKIAVIR
ncbi:hypothetical protein DRQ36_04755 [bacterium]|nr:MAG: hypothetical protein DRQ36_04755 [bacterium]